jgi:hypothetical protein
MKDSDILAEFPRSSGLSCGLRVFACKKQLDEDSNPAFRDAGRDGLGLASTPVLHLLRQKTFNFLHLATYLLVQAYQPV